jgi:radical SAM superfamily enzyme
MVGSRFNRHGDRLLERHGKRVWRVGVDGGFSCPNRDPTSLRQGPCVHDSTMTASLRGGGGCAYCAPSAGRAIYLPPSDAAPAVSDPADREADILAQIDTGISFLRRRYAAELFFLYFQAFTSTNASATLLRRIFDTGLSARHFEGNSADSPHGSNSMSTGFRGLVVSTRPDCLDEEKVELLSDYAARGLEVWVELGLQSAQPQSLERMRRGHTVEDFACAYRILQRGGLRTAVHLILGLPGESRQDMLSTIRFLASLEPDGVKFHDLYLPRGSIWAREYEAGEFVLLHPSRLPHILADCLELLPPSCEVMRLCSDAPRDQRIAPRKPLDKTIVYRDVEAELEARGSRQGSRY